MTGQRQRLTIEMDRDFIFHKGWNYDLPVEIAQELVTEGYAHFTHGRGFAHFTPGLMAAISHWLQSKTKHYPWNRNSYILFQRRVEVCIKCGAQSPEKTQERGTHAAIHDSE